MRYERETNLLGAYVPILDLAGKDATEIFDSVHTRGMLDDFDVIGELKK